MSSFQEDLLQRYTYDYKVLGASLYRPTRPMLSRVLACLLGETPNPPSLSSLSGLSFSGKEAWEWLCAHGLLPASWLSGEERSFPEGDALSLRMAVLMASDVEGIEAAERLAREAVRRLSGWGLGSPSGVCWMGSAEVLTAERLSQARRLARPRFVRPSKLEHYRWIDIGRSERDRDYYARGDFTWSGIDVTFRNIARRLKKERALNEYALQVHNDISEERERTTTQIGMDPIPHVMICAGLHARWELFSAMEVALLPQDLTESGLTRGGFRFSEEPNPFTPLLELFALGYSFLHFTNEEIQLGIYAFEEV